MPILAGWLTGEQVAQEIIEQTLVKMEEVLAQHGGTAGRFVQPGIGLVTFTEPAYAMQGIKEQPVLDWSPDLRTFIYRRPLSGNHPLYYIEDWPAKGNLLFASEIKALLSLGIPKRLHLAAIDALLRYGFIPAPWTAFERISVVPAGSILRWNHARTMVNHASDFALETDVHVPDIHQIEVQLQQACADILPEHTDVVALASGGYASSVSTMLTRQHTAYLLPVAALGTKARHAKAWRAVQHLTRTYDLPLLTITGIDQPEFWATALTALEMPCSDTQSFAFHQLIRTVRREMDARVAITGLGARLLSGSALPHTDHDTAIQPSSLSDDHALLAHYRHAVALPTPATYSLWSEDAVQALQSGEAWEDTLHARKLVHHAQHLPQKRQGLYYLDLHLRLPDGLVHPLQQIASFEGVAQRSPYLVPAIMNTFISMTTGNQSKDRQPLQQTLLERYAPDIASYPSLPLAIMATSLGPQSESELVRHMLSPEAIRNVGIFQPNIVQELQQQIHKPQAHSTLLVVFTTQLFYHAFALEGWA